MYWWIKEVICIYNRNEQTDDKQTQGSHQLCHIYDYTAIIIIIQEILANANVKRATAVTIRRPFA